MTTFFAWKVAEYEHRERPHDWYWAVGIIAVGGAVLAVIFNDLLFALVILVSAVALVLYAVRHPDELSCAIEDRGVIVNNTLYPYRTLESFWIHEHKATNELVLTSQKLFMPHVHVPLAGDINPDAIRDILLDYIPEIEIMPSVSEKLMEMAGF